MGTIRVQSPGLLSSIQDLGRPGRSAIGVPVGGAADPLSLRVGNRLLGNPDDTAAIEMTMVGGRFVFDDPAAICIVGEAPHCMLDDRPAPTNTPLEVPRGTTVSIGPITRGVRAYLCIMGGIDVPVVLGSRSTHLSGGFGGLEGRALRAGDRLAFAPTLSHTTRALPDALRHLIAAPPLTIILRAVPVGPIHEQFWSASRTVSSQSNRAGTRLSCSADPSQRGSVASARMITEGMPPGAIQLPPGGEPIILGPDHPTTGGYPILGCVASVDFHLVGRLRPGDTVRLQRITQREALAALRDREHSLNAALPPVPPR
jgi:antagonist of KipI